ncbi:MAG: hypothetical protein IJB27_06980 [Clostridia bacterium]|nr:hypothetical protein [Clostridia bacterium]
MIRRAMAVCLAMMLGALCLAMPASAAAEHVLLNEESTTFLSGGSYTENGALALQSGGNPVTAVIEWDEEINLNTTRYLQLSVVSSAPFNVALKLDGDPYDAYPQLTGPSWYEAFQDTAPASGEGVAHGSYVLSLDMKNYMEYNGLVVPKNGKMTLLGVYITMYGQGELTVSHLKLSDTAAFVTADGKGGTAATTLVPIIKHTQASRATSPYQGGSYDAGTPGGYSPEADAAGVVWFILLGVAAVGAVVVLTVVKKRRESAEEDDESDEDAEDETEDDESQETE